MNEAEAEQTHQLLNRMIELREKLQKQDERIEELRAELLEVEQRKEAEENLEQIGPPLSPGGHCDACHRVKDKDGVPFDGNKMKWVVIRKDRVPVLLCPACYDEIIGKPEIGPNEDKSEFRFGVRRGFRISEKQRRLEENPDLHPVFRLRVEEVSPFVARMMRAAQLTNNDNTRQRQIAELNAKNAEIKAREERRDKGLIDSVRWMFETGNRDVREAVDHVQHEQYANKVKIEDTLTDKDAAWVMAHLHKELTKKKIKHTVPAPKHPDLEPVRRRQPQRTTFGYAPGTQASGPEVELDVPDVWNDSGRVTGQEVDEEGQPKRKSVKYKVLHKQRKKKAEAEAAPRKETQTWVWTVAPAVEAKQEVKAEATKPSVAALQGITQRALEVDFGKNGSMRVDSYKLLPEHIREYIEWEKERELYEHGCDMYFFMYKDSTYSLYVAKMSDKDNYILALGDDVLCAATTSEGSVFITYPDLDEVEITLAELKAALGRTDVQAYANEMVLMVKPE